MKKPIVNLILGLILGGVIGFYTGYRTERAKVDALIIQPNPGGGTGDTAITQGAEILGTILETTGDSVAVCGVKNHFVEMDSIPSAASTASNFIAYGSYVNGTKQWSLPQPALNTDISITAQYAVAAISGDTTTGVEVMNYTAATDAFIDTVPALSPDDPADTIIDVELPASTLSSTSAMADMDKKAKKINTTSPITITIKGSDGSSWSANADNTITRFRRRDEANKKEIGKGIRYDVEVKNTSTGKGARIHFGLVQKLHTHTLIHVKIKQLQ